MQVIARIVGRKQVGQRHRVADDGVEINHAVVEGIGSEPGVDSLPGCFASYGVIGMAAEWRYRCPVRAQVARVSFVGKLRISVDQICRQRRSRGGTCTPYVINTLKDDQPAGAALI